MLQPKNSEWLNGLKKKNNLHICCLEESCFRFRGTYKLKVRGWMEKGIPCKRKPIKAKTAIRIPDKINVKIKTITRDNERHYLTIQESIHEEDITIVKCIQIQNLNI